MGIISREALNKALREQNERATEILAREDLLARATKRFGPDDPQTTGGAASWL